MKEKQISDRRAWRMLSDKIDVKELKNKTKLSNKNSWGYTHIIAFQGEVALESVARLGSLETSLFICQRALPGMCPGPSTWAQRISNLARCSPSLFYHPFCLGLSRALWSLFQLGVQRVDGFVVLPGHAASWAISLCLQGLLLCIALARPAGPANCLQSLDLFTPSPHLTNDHWLTFSSSNPKLYITPTTEFQPIFFLC